MTAVDRDLRRRPAPPTADGRHADAPPRPGGRRPAPGIAGVPLIADAVAVLILVLAARAARGPGAGSGHHLVAVLFLTAIAGALVAAGRVAVATFLSADGSRMLPAAPATGAVLAAAPLATVLVPLLRAGRDARAALGPALALAAAAVATASAVTWLAALLVPRLADGRRKSVLPAMLTGSAAGTLAVLFVPVTAAALRTVAGAVPSGALLTYATAAAAAFGLAQIVVLHRLARVGGRGVALVAVAALAVGTAEALLPAAPKLDDGVVGLVAAAAVLLVGLGSATLTGGPAAIGLERFGIGIGRPPAEPEAQPIAPAPLAAGRTEHLDAAAVALLSAAAAVGIAIRFLVGSTGGAGDAVTDKLTGGSFHDALAGTVGAPHPPLSIALAWCSRHVLGGSLLALRLPSLLAGVLVIPAAFAAGRLLYDRRTAVAAAAVAAIGPAFVWVSGDSGPAAVTALLVCVAIAALAWAQRDDGPAAWILFGLAAAAVVWSHQFGVVTVAVLHIAAGVAVARRYRAARAASERRPLVYVAGWASALGVTVLAVVALVAWRHGFGAPSAPASLEYATNAAPGGGHTPFGLAAGALSTIVGFHPPDVTSRLLALWPLGILAAFALFGRRWSIRGVLLIGLAAAPFAALLAADLVGSPRQPPLALTWLAPALPAIALATGRAVDRLAAGQRRFWPALAAVAAVLALATADQAARVVARPAAPPAAGPAATAPGPSSARLHGTNRTPGR